MNIEEARLYLEHTSKEDFNLEEHQKENRYKAIQVLLKEIERLNNIISKKNKMINNTRHFMANLELTNSVEVQHLHDIDERLRYIMNYLGVDKE